MPQETISILDGSTFLVSDLRGDVVASPDEAQGFFYRDTRFLSLWRLTVDGEPLDALSTDDLAYFQAQFFLVPANSTVYENPIASVIRKRAIGDGFHEDLAVLNHQTKPLDIELRLDAGSDFADLFEVKDALAKKGAHSRHVEHGEQETLVLSYEREDFIRATRIWSSKPCEVDEDGFTFRLNIEPHGEWSTCLFVQPVVDRVLTIKYRHDDDDARPNIGMSLEQFLETAPKLHCDWDPFEHIYERSLIDLAALRFESEFVPGAALPAAGLPWFMTVFGRDSLITSYQALPFVPELAATTLRVLAARQSTQVDDFRDAEPGKILHEIRFGEMTHFDERPHSPYFGTADATPLFLVLLDEYERWTGDAELVRHLEPRARLALSWIDEYGDLDGDGYVEYKRRNEETGLENQCWKDSWDSMLFADGTIAEGPIAVCEIQGYVYDAKRRAARLAREIWGDEELAARLDAEAEHLRTRFNIDFWLPGRDAFALALDGQKRQVDSLTSNIGHLLWSGIVDDDKAEAVAQHLVSPALFSGWGVRTMAEGEGGYNPIRYHNGTVWPHDTSLVAHGLQRYGFRDEAALVAQATLEAATYFRYRLPEVFAGYHRERTGFPVEYPTSCSPQAWATAAPLLFLRVLLGLEPDGDELGSNPHLCESIAHVELREIPGRWGRADVSTGELTEAQ
ncbi:MAG TPA: glycogen debranching N-terminal domain-containing protein [Gaiellaceae bacterium]|jgi:glycogen debranching enzyme|nr:glycogen debranching N-terminal domain-containing protein [Gaiellaceae bacterium]